MSTSSAVVASTIGSATPSFRAVLGTSSATVHWVARIGQDRNFRGARHQFPEDLYSCCDESSWHVDRKPRYVAAWTRQTLDEAKSNGIGHSHEYNRNGSSCRFQG